MIIIVTLLAIKTMRLLHLERSETTNSSSKGLLIFHAYSHALLLLLLYCFIYFHLSNFSCSSKVVIVPLFEICCSNSATSYCCRYSAYPIPCYIASMNLILRANIQFFSAILSYTLIFFTIKHIKYTNFSTIIAHSID